MKAIFVSFAVNSVGKFLLLFVLLVFFATANCAQENTNLLEKVNLKFTLSAEPTAEDVGFNNPKSSWNVKYDLYLIDFSELEKLGRCSRDEYNRHICLPMKNKKLDKRIRKKSMKISKGNFTEKSLAAEAGREVAIPVNLQPNVIEIYNQAAKMPERNPAFVLFVTTKVSTKNSARAKLKRKYSVNGIKPLKMADSNKTFEFWDVRNLSLNITIAKQENGQLRLIGGLIH